MNPYYNHEELGLDIVVFDQPDMYYEYNTLIFVKAKEGQRVFWAQDSGCSCPTPFEDYEGSTSEEVFAKMARVPSFEEAQKIIWSWKKKWDDGTMIQVPSADLRRLREWFK